MSSPRDKEILVPLSLVTQILQDFKSLNCGSCSQHVGYRHMKNDNAIFCTSSSCIEQWLKKTERKLKGIEMSSSMSSSSLTSRFGNLEMKSGSSYLNQRPERGQKILRTSLHSEPEKKPLINITKRGQRNLLGHYPVNRSDNPACLPENNILKVTPPTQQVAMTTANRGCSEPRNNESQSHGLFRRAIRKKTDVPAGADSIWTIEESKLTESIKDGASVSIKFMWTPAVFTVIATADESKILELQEAIGTYCATEPNLSENPATEQIVFALYKGEYYRAVVKDVRKDHVRVRFLDFGDSTNVSHKECKRACRKIMQEYPIYGMIFNCSTSQPVPRDLPLTKAMNDETYREFVIEITRRQQWKCYGKMYFMTGHIRKEWNQMLEDRIMELKCRAQNTNPPPSTVACFEKNYSPLMISEMELSPNMKNGSLVCIIYKFNFRKLLVASVEDAPGIKTVGSLVKRHAKTAPFMERVPREKEIVLAQKANQEKWYRAVIDSVDCNIVEVTFIDVGGTSILGVEYLKELSPEIRTLPLYSIIFLLHDLPEDVRAPMTPEIEIALHKECQIEVMSQQDKLSWCGTLWVAEDRTWSTLVQTAMKTEDDS